MRIERHNFVLTVLVLGLVMVIGRVGQHSPVFGQPGPGNTIPGNGTIPTPQQNSETLFLPFAATSASWVNHQGILVFPSRFYEETFDGEPDQPEIWKSDDWELTIHQRDQDRLYEMLPMQADHGPNCEAPPASRIISSHEENFYICRNHLMTANHGTSKNGGYGMVYFTPNRMIDTTDDFFISFDMSTYRVNPIRNWVDVWITPYDKNLQLALNESFPDLRGEPTQSIQIQLSQGGWLRLIVHENGVSTKIGEDDFRTYHDVLEMSRTVRTNFYIGVKNGNLKIGLPEHNMWWYDQPAPELMLRSGWEESIVQFGHHSYTPYKGCQWSLVPDECNEIMADTFHWDNINLYPVREFDLIQGDIRLITDSTSTKSIRFDRPAPADAYLRFGGIGLNLEVSFDNGSSWEPAVEQEHVLPDVEERFSSFWMPIPEGAQTVQFRGDNWWAGEWAARDISVWAR